MAALAMIVSIPMVPLVVKNTIIAGNTADTAPDLYSAVPRHRSQS